MARVTLVSLALLVICTLAVGQKFEIINGQKEVQLAKQALSKAGNYKTFLRLLQASGFESVLARYVQSQPVTLLVPTDTAFANLPLRVKSQLSGSKLIKMMEYQMLLHKFPVAFLRYAQPGGLFQTVYGVHLVKQNTALSNTVMLAPPGAVLPSEMAVVTNGDIAESKLLLMGLHGINHVLLPPDVFY